MAHLLEELTEWARADPAVGAAVLVGSYARGAERMSSDVDVVVLGDTPMPSRMRRGSPASARGRA